MATFKAPSRNPCLGEGNAYVTQILHMAASELLHDAQNGRRHAEHNLHMHSNSGDCLWDYGLKVIQLLPLNDNIYSAEHFGSFICRLEILQFFLQLSDCHVQRDGDGDSPAVQQFCIEVHCHGRHGGAKRCLVLIKCPWAKHCFPNQRWTLSIVCLNSNSCCNSITIIVCYSGLRLQLIFNPSIYNYGY